MSRRDRERDDRAIVREALRTAPGPAEPDVTHLVEAVPELMAEARRRRSAAAAAGDLASALGERARLAIPKLAVATAVVVVLATTVTLLDRSTTGANAAAFDSLVLTGEESDGYGSSDILLDAVTKGDETDG